jgi:hypothetical protein
LPAVDDEQFRKQLACARDPALYRPDRHLTDRCRFVIGEARRGDQKQRLALNVRQLCKSLDELLEFQTAELLGGAISGWPGSCHPDPRLRGGACDIATEINCGEW